MGRPEVRAASIADVDEVVNTLMLGFAADPLVRWHFPEPGSYVTVMPRFVLALGRGALEAETACLVDGGRGAALPVPPGLGPDYEALADIVDEMLRPFPDIARDFELFLDQVTAFHVDEPHWYLPLIAVDPRWHGHGLGSAMLAHILARSDADASPIYLEASSPRNVALYLRHGFEVLGEIQAGSSPVMTPMLRRPQ